MYAYLGIAKDGTFELAVSTVSLSPVGTRLERGPHQRLPESIRLQAENPADPMTAIAALISLDRFCKGEEIGATGLQFGDKLPGKKK